MESIRPDPHTIFLQRFDNSHEAVLKIAELYYLRGYRLRLGPIRRSLVPGAGQPESDDGDLFVSRGAPRLRVEVKRSLNKQWTTRFPWPTCIIEGVAQHDRRQPEPDVYHWLNWNMTRAYSVPRKSKIYWQIKAILDREMGITRDTYIIPRRYVKFWRVPHE